MNYRFDRKMRAMGQIVAGAFDDDGRYFLTMSNAGWLLVWDLRAKIMLNKTHLANFQQLEDKIDMKFISDSRNCVLLSLPASDRLLMLTIEPEMFKP